MKVEVQDPRTGGVYDALDFEHEVREGRVPLDTLVAGKEWTGGAFRKVREVEALREAIDTPHARFADHLRKLRFPFAVLGTAGIVFLCGLLQVFGLPLAAAAGASSDSIERLIYRLAMGWVPSVLEGGWWTPWSSELVHAGLGHVLGNLPLWLYSGWRVERALGRSGLLVVLASAVLVATPTIVYLSDLPVVGSSLGAFGLLGAQIAIGLRKGQRIPEGYRSAYGFANLVVSLPMFMLTWDKPGVSHLAHFSGLIGGAAAGFLCPIAPEAPRRRAVAVGLLNVGLAGLLAVLPMGFLVVLGFLPKLSGVPWAEETSEEGGLTMVMPDRMRRIEGRFARMDCWFPDANSDDCVFAASYLVNVGTKVDEAFLRKRWNTRYGDASEVRPGTFDGPEGWESRVWTFPGAGGGTRVTEVTRVRGRYLWTIGWVSDADAPDGGPKERMFAEILRSVSLREPKDLVDARGRHEKWPDDGKFAYNYAQELIAWGEPATGHQVLAKLLGHTDGWEWEAVRSTLALWEETPEAETALTPDVVARFVHEAPLIDDYVVRPGTAWLAGHGRCDAVATELPRWREEAKTADQSALDTLVGVEETSAGTCAGSSAAGTSAGAPPP